MYDIIVIGGGPAGLTAALYARRANRSVLVIEKGTFGGQITYSPKVENIPGFGEVTGNEFAEKLVSQAILDGSVRTVPIENEPFARTHHIVYHRHKFLTRSAREFIALCHEIEKSPSPGSADSAPG